MAPTSSARCRIGWHHYAKRVNDEGVAYLECVRCHKESWPGPTVGFGPLT